MRQRWHQILQCYWMRIKQRAKKAGLPFVGKARAKEDLQGRQRTKRIQDDEIYINDLIFQERILDPPG
jgi:hypothetical protein